MLNRSTTDADNGTLAATVAITLPVLLMLALASAVEAQVAGVGGVFTEVEPELSADASPETLSSLLPNAAETPGMPTIRSRLVRVALDQLAAARAAATAVDVEGGPGAALTLNLFDDVVLSAIVERATPTASGTGYALSGRIDGGEEPRELGAMTLLVYGEMLAGTVSAAAGTFIIQPVGDGVHAISQVDTSALPPPGEPLLPPLEEETPENGSPRSRPPTHRRPARATRTASRRRIDAVRAAVSLAAPWRNGLCVARPVQVDEATSYAQSGPDPATRAKWRP